MRILILGAGAVGGYFGALLQNNGLDVTFLVREKRAEHLAVHGLNIISKLGNVHVRPKVISSLSGGEKYDLAIISCKSYSLEEAMQSLAPLDRSAFILPLLNGISHYEQIKSFFGRSRILGGFAHLSTATDEDGNIVHLNTLQVLTLGVLETEQTAFIHRCSNILLPAAPFLIFSDNICRDIWQKLIFIATAAAATCLMDRPMGEIVSTNEGAGMISESFELSCTAAAHAGNEPSPAWKSATLKSLLDVESTMTSSLLRDIRQGNRAEISILHDMLDANRAAGLQNQLLESGHRAVMEYELQRTSGAGKMAAQSTFRSL